MQLDPKYLDAVSYLKQQLARLQISDAGWLARLEQHTGLSLVGDAVKPATEQFPADDAVLKRFSIEGLRAALEDMAADQANSVRVSTGELEAAAREQQVLLDLQRYLARRKRSRATRLVNAAHRRAILTHPQGPINRQLSLAVEELLTLAR